MNIHQEVEGKKTFYFSSQKFITNFPSKKAKLQNKQQFKSKVIFTNAV